jgi:outer membrane protein OmpA-like peptidoglycan-associated protein
MSFNLIESVKNIFSDEMTNKMAAILGESSMNVQQAMKGIIPSVITGIILMSEDGDPQDIVNIAKEAAKIELPLNQASLAWWWNTNYKGLDYLKTLFGERTPDITAAIAGYSGLSSKSASSLLNVAAPLAFCVLGKHLLEKNMSVNGLRSFLSSEKKIIFNLLPAGIFLEGFMGFENLSGVSEKFSSSENSRKRKNAGTRLVLPIIFIVLAAAGILYFITRKLPPETPLYSVVQKVIPPKDTIARIPILKENQYSVKLSNGKALIVKKGSIEDQLVIFFNDPKSRPSKRFPYNFDQLNFINGSAEISEKSMVQVHNIALILKAYPKVKIKIGGFNEKGGDSLMNSIISSNRASAVAKALKAAGVNPNQIAGVEGFGSDFAKYAAEAADSLKEKDSRISISIRSK